MSQKLAEPWPTVAPPSPAVARNLERIAWLMDRAIRIPGTKITLGLDAILGLLPLGGDVLTGFVQVMLVLVALRTYRVPKHVAARMVGNVLLDVAVGTIPVLGDLFDVAFKANTANLKLLEPYRGNLDASVTGSAVGSTRGKPITVTEDHIVVARPGGMPWRYILPIAGVLLGALCLVLIGFVTVIRWLFAF